MTCLAGPFLSQLFGIVQLCFTFYCHVELLTEKVQIQYAAVKGRNIDLWQYDATADSVCWWIACAFTEHHLIRELKSKKDLSRADSWQNWFRSSVL